MNGTTIRRHKNARFLGDSKWISFGSSSDSVAGYDGANDEWTVRTKDAGGAQTDRLRVKGNQDITRLEIFNDDPAATGVRLDAYHNSASPAMSDAPLHLRIFGMDGAGTPAKAQYGGLKWTITNVSDGAEEGRLDVELMKAGSLATLLQYKSGAFAFQEATIVSTSTGNLTLNPSGDVDLNSNTLSNIGASGNDWSANTFQHQASVVGTQFMLLENTSANGSADALLRIKTNTAANDPQLELSESGGNSWFLGLDNDQTDRLFLGTGAGATNNAIRVTHATPPVVTYNTTHPTGAFDYVCDGCGRHLATEFECCGPVNWHDDVMDFRAMALRSPSATAYMERVGVIELGRDENGRPEVFTRLGPDFHFAMSAAFQNRERIDRLSAEHETRFSAVEDRVESLEEAQTILRARIVALGGNTEA